LFCTNLHWPCVTDFSGLSTYGLKGYEREMSTPSTLRRGMVDFTFTFYQPESGLIGETHSQESGTKNFPNTKPTNETTQLWSRACKYHVLHTAVFYSVQETCTRLKNVQESMTLTQKTCASFWLKFLYQMLECVSPL